MEDGNGVAMKEKQGDSVISSVSFQCSQSILKRADGSASFRQGKYAKETLDIVCIGLYDIKYVAVCPRLHLFSVLFCLILPTHEPNHSITCNLCHTCVKALVVELLLLLPPAQPIVLVLLSQLSPAHPPQFGDDSQRRNQRMQTGVYLARNPECSLF